MTAPSHAIRLLAAGAVAYCAGSFPTADLVSRMAARRNGSPHLADLRLTGTGNPGAMNAINVLGARWGLAVLAGDMAKGMAACLAGRRIAGDDGAYVAGIASVAGHCLPAWNGSRGGKGVATSAGTTAVCFPIYMPVDVALATGAFMISRGKAELATYVASGLFTAAGLLWHRRRWPNLWGPRPSAWLPAYAAATSAVIAWRFLAAPLRQDPATQPDLVLLDHTEEAESALVT